MSLNLVKLNNFATNMRPIFYVPFLFLDTVTMANAIDPFKSVLGAGSWQMMVCLDRLVELGEIYEVPTPCNGRGQYWIFVSPHG